MIPNFDNYLFRCSSLGKIMVDGKSITEKQLESINQLQLKEKRTEKQEEELKRLIEKRDNPELSDGVKKHLQNCFISHVYGRQEEVKNKFVEKGNFVEEDSITLISKFEGFLSKNKIHFENEFIKGTPDAISNDCAYDAKSSWSIFTFPMFDTEIENADYWWQLQGYMWLTTKPKSKLCYCLINCPDHLIEDEEKRLYYRLKPVDETSSEFQDELNKLRKNLIFDDIPEDKRIKIFELNFDNSAIEKLKNRIIECRKYLNSLSEIHFKTK